MKSRCYLLACLVALVACSEEEESQAGSGSGGTGTTAGTGGGGGSQATLDSGGSGGSQATLDSGGSGSMSAGGVTGGGGTVGGSSGAAGEGGAGGEGGAAVACVPALHAMVRAIFGDFRCTELEDCIVEHCPDELANVAGEGWRAGDYTGGICAEYVDCVDACDCESDCTRECRDTHASAGPCLDAVVEVSLCRNDACPTAVDSCGP